ncbi:phosphatase PAP2 family protein [Phreatobacter stygius]|uniref:Phosphatase PAP2 family protein n=1 Tax=Phreatobacter stygius TaxID=1940610 RepID=A0A4D7B0S0_9HYPH|nr:phosphatase PAP2 family protein [Phreatobacter stygius]QCI63620.1 phosphatase PAP2 family protein [Phreatobacter stygius]
MTFMRHLRWSTLRHLIKNELGLVLTLAVAAGGLLIFLRLADEVVEGETAAFDRAVLLAFRHGGDPSIPIGPTWLPTVMRDITALGGVAVLSLIVLFAFSYLMLVRKRGAAVFLVASVLGGLGLSQGLKILFGRVRPDLVPNAPIELSASFPSGHSMLSAVTYLTLGALLTRVEPNRRARSFFPVVAVILTVLVGVSRVYIGVHWPTDVLAGWSLGAAWAMLCWMVVLWLQRRGRIERRANIEG